MPGREKKHMKVVTFFLFLLLFAGAVFAQSNDEGLAFLQLNFFNPGARSLAMGGAFVGMADDATAALANPAGMTALIRPEFSVEFSATKYKNEIPWTSGSQLFDLELDLPAASARESNFQNNFGPIDFDNTVSHLSFASFVYPAIKNKFVISGFYNEQTKFERQFQTTGYDRILRSVNGIPCTVDCLFNSFFATDNSLEFKIRNFGASVAVSPSNYLSLGVTLTSSKLEVDSSTTRLDQSNNNVPVNRESLTGDDTGFSYAFGALLKPSSKFSFGFVYTHRPEFDVTSNAATLNPDGTVDQQVSINPTFRVPDNFGFGISVRPSDRFAINFDVNRIKYSQLNDGYYNAFFFADNFPDSLQNTKIDFSKNDLEVEDGTEFRLGGEYAVSLGSHPFFIRAGYWHEPFHSQISTVEDANQVLIFTIIGGFLVQVNEVNADPFFSRSLKKDYNHVSFGTGIGFGQVTIDWAYDYSKNFKRFILSTNFHL